MKRILLTTCSFQDTPGPHHEKLESAGFDIVRERGPLPEARMLELAGEFDAFLCGDDRITRDVLEKSGARLKVISKYGIGLDKIDLDATKDLNIPVMFTPGVNHTTVAEHTFCLLLALTKNLIPTVDATRQGNWLRMTGHELWQKRIGLIGLGRIGIETAKRARGFDMDVHAFGNYWPEKEAAELGITRHDTLESLFSSVDIISPHTKYTPSTYHIINEDRIRLMPKGSWIVNTGRGELVDSAAVLSALSSDRLAGYGTDVMEQEPPVSDDPLLSHPKTIVTSHIGSRTFESVPRQAMKAVDNLINYLNQDGEYFCANGVA